MALFDRQMFLLLSFVRAMNAFNDTPHFQISNVTYDGTRTQVVQIMVFRCTQSESVDYFSVEHKWQNWSESLQTSVQIYNAPKNHSKYARLRKCFVDVTVCALVIFSETVVALSSKSISSGLFILYSTYIQFENLKLFVAIERSRCNLQNTDSIALKIERR